MNAYMGEYVVIQIDPFASLESALLYDPEVLGACQAMRNKKYVACLTWAVQSANKYLSGTVCFVSQGLTCGNPDEDITPAMSLPILPNTSHPESREPLDAKEPLPWPDLYQQTQAVAKIRFRNTPADGKALPHSPHSLSVSERYELLLGQEVDECRREDLARARQKAEASDYESATSSSCTAMASSDAGWSADETVCTDSGAGHGSLAEIVPVVEMTIDLESVDVVNDPWEFFEEVQALERLVYEHKKRHRLAIEKAIKLDSELAERIILKHRVSSVEKDNSPRFKQVVQSCRKKIHALASFNGSESRKGFGLPMESPKGPLDGVYSCWL
ncbi:uncharacterized protein BT62DRAFT_273586 [Guyanagaster necrorhizus]|uniref:Uncharacterized protein n=1 Tax=Guyanagaster necrorhizus TaxID=856835 RepID=A0A9P7W3W2_9AGAR|nr:uncharacterized protein BT62DRAFT_273586 [Guyanagaster necrorhizus MCA 3950]KAG7451960.1 hypothetical protein BT62DRAFT_273586 [Guyanagaster necrorhizus MCA 3950]